MPISRACAGACPCARRRASTSVDLAAGDRRRGEEGGRLDPVGHDAVVDRPRASPGSTPWMTSVDEPMPVDLGAHGVEEVAEVGDLGLAGGVVEHRRALGVHGGHQDVLGGADARELEGDVGPEEARRPGPRGSRGAARTCAPSASRPSQVHVDRPGAEVVAARQRHPRPAAAGRAAARARRSRPGSARPARRAPPASIAAGRSMRSDRRVRPGSRCDGAGPSRRGGRS